MTIFQRALSIFLLAMFGGVFALPSAAEDMPKAAGSPIAGITFDDQPLLLPDQRNFQMAMITASSELGRSCGRMESYGWRLAADEQGRVNQIFNNTVDRLRAQGYAVENRSSQVVSSDVTLFVADRPDKHLIFLWSAGELGLVMVLCETSAPMPAIPEYRTRQGNEVAGMTDPLAAAQSLRASASDPYGTYSPRTGKPVDRAFSPVGTWTGTYTCSQGTTGASLSIRKMKGDQYEGEFRFYPTARNPYVPRGGYKVFGEYDPETQRILINPGKWIERPEGYQNTIIVGSFNSVAMTFSGYFQGINGCTSFEANYDSKGGPARTTKAITSQKKKTAPKKPVAKNEVVVEKIESDAPAKVEEKKPDTTTEPTPKDLEPKSLGTLELPTKPPALAPEAAPPQAVKPVNTDEPLPVPPPAKETKPETKETPTPAPATAKPKTTAPLSLAPDQTSPKVDAASEKKEPETSPQEAGIVLDTIPTK